MGIFKRTRESRETRFIKANAEELALQLAGNCATVAKEICDEIGDELPDHVNIDTLFTVILSLRAAIEARGIRNQYGQTAFETLIAAMHEVYGAKIDPDFIHAILEAEKTINENPDPLEWPRRHCMKLLQTQDPEDEILHISLGQSLLYGDPLAKIVKKEA
jgi:dsRNA-specific ribonuclease